MDNYTRGQETFLGRFHGIISNLIRLFFITIGLSLVLWLYLIPAQFWIDLHKIFIFSKQNFTLFGIFKHRQEINSLVNKFIFIHHESVYLSLKKSLIPSVIFFISAVVFFIRRGKSILKDDFNRGSKLLTTSQFNKAYKNTIKQEIEEISKDSGKKLTYKSFLGNPFIFNNDKLKIPEYALYRHVGMLGSTGTGKSTLIKHYLEYCRKNGEKAIIPDPNGEYASEFKREGDIVLSLYDKRSEFWSFWGETHQGKGVKLSEFSRFLVPSSDDRNSFFWKGARLLLTSLLETSQTIEELWSIVGSEKNEKMGDYVSGLSKKILGPEGSSQASGIIGSSLLELSFLKDLNYWPCKQGKKTPFSIFDWAQNKDPSWVFITFTDTDLEIVKPLLRVWLNLAILGLLQRKIDDNQIPLNIVIDELSSLGRLELLPMALDRARKYKGKVILGYQSDHQLMSIYGKEMGSSMKSLIGNRFIFRCTESHEAKELSEFLGAQEVQRKDTSNSYGTSSKLSDRENLSERSFVKYIVLESEIRNLSDGYFYLKSLHLNPVKSRIFKKRWDKIEPLHQDFHGYPINRIVEDCFDPMSNKTHTNIRSTDSFSLDLD